MLTHMIMMNRDAWHAANSSEAVAVAAGEGEWGESLTDRSNLIKVDC